MCVLTAKSLVCGLREILLFVYTLGPDCCGFVSFSSTMGSLNQEMNDLESAGVEVARYCTVVGTCNQEV